MVKKLEDWLDGNYGRDRRGRHARSSRHMSFGDGRDGRRMGGSVDRAGTWFGRSY